MDLMNRTKQIGEYLDELIPNPVCELNFNKDYELLIAIVLSAQTTDKRVNQVTGILFNKYPTLELLKDADIVDVENILKPLGSFHKKSLYVKEIAKILNEEFNDNVPVDRKILESFPGVGRKTVNVFFSEFYNIPAFAVDTHVERVSKRLGLAKIQDNVLIIEEKLKRKFKRETWCKRHKQLVLFGRYYCKAIKPSCNNCSLINICKEKNKRIISEEE